jgi:hypothetical protein
MTAQDRDLVTQNKQLDVLGCVAAEPQRHQLHRAACQRVEQ